MKLYLVRHGESEANKLGLHNTPETKLTEDGIRQAAALAKRFKNKNIDFIYSSSSTRTLQTAERISNELGLPVEKWDEIVEVKTPSANWGKPRSDEKVSKIEKIVDENYLKNLRHSDEETFEELKARAERVLKHLVKNHIDQTVLLVSHTSFVKMLFLTAITGRTLSADFYISFRDHSYMMNSGITVLEYSETRGWILVTMNDISHL